MSSDSLKFFVRKTMPNIPALPSASSRRWAAGSLLPVVLALSACGSVGAGIGIGIPIGPFSVGVGLGSGGLSAGVGTGVGPLGVGVGVNQGGQVSASAGLGASTGVGGARVGAGVGSSAVIYDPARAQAPSGTEMDGSAAPSAPAPVQWRDAEGRAVPECRLQGAC